MNIYICRVHTNLLQKFVRKLRQISPHTNPYTVSNLSHIHKDSVPYLFAAKIVKKMSQILTCNAPYFFAAKFKNCQKIETNTNFSLGVYIQSQRKEMSSLATLISTFNQTNIEPSRP